MAHSVGKDVQKSFASFAKGLHINNQVKVNQPKAKNYVKLKGHFEWNC